MFGKNGRYAYETCFCASPIAQKKFLEIDILAADFVKTVSSNGHPLDLPLQPGQYCGASGGPCQVVTKDPALLISGRNCIVIEVDNTGGAPTGISAGVNVSNKY